ncbi:MAG: hypothetical protein H6R13_500 [Proteobacteria bacterium]|nr:hypothetical protein [Pseudomonadota bacterium]
MKYSRTLIATCIVALFASNQVLAKDSRQFHEEDWSKTRSYAKVLISQDSVENWGAWTDFVEPAAGAPSPVAMPGMSGGDQYRKSPDIIIPEDKIVDKGCASGAWCGYAIFNDSTTVKRSGGRDYRSSSYDGGSNDKRYSAGLFALMLTPDRLPISNGTRGTASWGLEALNGADAPNFASSGTPEAVKFYEYLNHFHTQGENASFIDGVSHGPNWGYEAASMFSPYGGDHYFDKAITGFQYKTGEEQYTYYDWRGKPHKGWRDVYVTLKADQDVAIGQFERESVESYTSGEGKKAITTTITTTTTGYYVAGIATPQSYLDAQSAGNVTAKYVGGSFDGSQQGKVDITVQFRPGTWTGNWSQNGGFDFNAAGTINGANISGNVVNTKNLQGTVNGTFYGQTAGSIGGVSSVQNMRTEATQNAIFLVNKVPVVPSSPKP